MPFLSPEANILEAFAAHLETIPWAKTVTWKKARLTVSDFRSDECPVIQIHADTQTFQSEHNDQIIRWRVFVELVLLSDTSGAVDQLDLLEKADFLFKHIGSNFRLNGNIRGFQQIIPIGSIHELRIVEPYYISVLELEFAYRKYFTHPC